jgi:hypothetical protein
LVEGKESERRIVPVVSLEEMIGEAALKKWMGRGRWQGDCRREKEGESERESGWERERIVVVLVGVVLWSALPCGSIWDTSLSRNTHDGIFPCKDLHTEVRF